MRIKRDDPRALAAIKDADTALMMLSRCIFDLCSDDEKINEDFNTFAVKVSKTLSKKVTAATLRESGDKLTGDITTWYKERE